MFNQPPTKKDPCSVVFIALFFVPQKTEHLERGKFGPPHTSVENFNWDRGNAGENSWRQPGRGGGGVF